jgi:hypothetical protein
VWNVGEDCDPNGGTATSCQAVANTSAAFTCSPTCQCACPTFVKFTGVAGTIGVLDSGWTGQGHDATVISDGTVTVGVTSCAGTSRPCGVCNLLGPVDNLSADAGEINNHRCTGNTRTKCTTNADCSVATGTYEYYFGTYLPLAAGGVATCVGSQINGTITGTANVETGSAASSVQLISRVYTGPNPNPCPRCVGDATPNDNARGGTCDAGTNVNLSCDVNGSSPNPYWGSTSLDCPPTGGAQVAALPINLTNSTGTETRTVSSANPNCRAPGFTSFKCLCDTCNNAAATPCGTERRVLGSGPSDRVQPVHRHGVLADEHLCGRGEPERELQRGVGVSRRDVRSRQRGPVWQRAVRAVLRPERQLPGLRGGYRLRVAQCLRGRHQPRRQLQRRLAVPRRRLPVEGRRRTRGLRHREVPRVLPRQRDDRKHRECDRDGESSRARSVEPDAGVAFLHRADDLRLRQFRSRTTGSRAPRASGDGRGHTLTGSSCATWHIIHLLALRVTLLFS